MLVKQKLIWAFILLVLGLTYCDSDVATGGTNCGQTFSESETSGTGGSNDSAPNAQDFGIVLAPKCKVTITGWQDWTGAAGVDQIDCFAFDPGKVNGVLFKITWDNDSNPIDLSVQDTVGSSLLTGYGFSHGYDQLLWASTISNYKRVIKIGVSWEISSGGTALGNTTYSLTMEGY